jgi:hypothetical protein
MEIHYRDDENLYPSATLNWEGPGYYAAICANGHCTIDNVDHLIDEDESPYPRTNGTGYGTPVLADTPAQAAGNYAGHDA